MDNKLFFLCHGPMIIVMCMVASIFVNAIINKTSLKKASKDYVDNIKHNPICIKLIIMLWVLLSITGIWFEDVFQLINTPLEVMIGVLIGMQLTFTVR